MEFVSSILLNFVLPVLVILVSFVLVFTYGFKGNESQPDFKGFSHDDEEEKTKTKKLKPKKTTKKTVQVSREQNLNSTSEKLASQLPIEHAVSKKNKKDVKNAEKLEASMNSDEWTVKKDRKIKKKQDKVPENDKSDAPEMKYAATNHKNVEQNKNNVDTVSVNKTTVAKIVENVLLEDSHDAKTVESASVTDGNTFVKVENKNNKKSMKIEKPLEKAQGSVKASEGSKEVKVSSQLDKILELQVQEFNLKMKAFELQRNKDEKDDEVVLVVEDGSGMVEKEEKQIVEVAEVGDVSVMKKKSKKSISENLDFSMEIKRVEDKVETKEKSEGKEEGSKIEGTVVEVASTKPNKKKKKKTKSVVEASQETNPDNSVSEQTVKVESKPLEDQPKQTKAQSKPIKAKVKPIKLQDKPLIEVTPQLDSSQLSKSSISVISTSSTTKPTTKPKTKPSTKPTTKPSTKPTTKPPIKATIEPKIEPTTHETTQPSPKTNGVSNGDTEDWQEAKPLKRKKKVLKAL